MKKIIAIMLSVLFMITATTPALTSFASDETDSISIQAQANNPITIEKKNELPDEWDYNGVLSLSAGYYNIERDYSQTAIITVTNTSDLSVEYFLTVLNTYDDIYLNFVRSGSLEIPLVIAAGETQEVQLDIFAQNATRAEYELPIYAHTVVGESESVDSKTTAYVSCPVVNLNVSLTKKSEDPNTLAQVYTLKNNGNAISDLTVSVDGELMDYVMLTPIQEYVYMNRNDSIEFTAMPDLYKMETNNIDCIEGNIVVSAGGASYRYNTKFDTLGQKIITTTIGELVALQMSNFSTDSVFQTKATGMGTIRIPSDGSQCTNAGKVTTNTQIPATGGMQHSPSTQSDSDTSKVRIFLTSRMYGGGYVNRQVTNYDYYINGVKTIRSTNTGLTELSIVELPVDNIKFGANNTIVRDYDTNPGSHFVTANTEISILYPGDTPISYIGSPKTLPDYRPLPDFAVYSENIFNDSDNIIVGAESQLSVNIYNRGSTGGTFDLTISSGETVLYSEKDRYLDAFSGDNISFDWTPQAASETITVSLENTTDGFPEVKLDNNNATRTFSVRQRAIPKIISITPDYAVEGEGIVYATVSNYADVTRVEFYVDDQLYSGDVKSSEYAGTMRYWINDESMASGAHTIRVVVYYAISDTETASIEATADLNVLPADWNQYKFVVDENVSYPNFYLKAQNNAYLSSIYDIQRNGNEYTYSMSKAVYDNQADYSIFAVSNNAVLFKALTDNKDLLLDDCNELSFIADNIYISGITLRKINDCSVYAWMNTNSPLYLAPGQYNIVVDTYFMGEYRQISVDVDMTKGDVTINLADYFNVFTFAFADEVNGYPNAMLYYKTNSNDAEWVSIWFNSSFDDSILTCTIPNAYTNVLETAEEAFITVTTSDTLFVADLDLNSDSLTKDYTIDKSKLQKYSLSAGGSETEFGITDVSVETDRFSAWLSSPTIYLSYGEYAITVYCRDISNLDSLIPASNGIRFAPADELDKVKLTVKAADAYSKHAKLYGTGSTGFTVDANPYTLGDKIDVDKDIYNLNVTLSRNESTFTVSAVADASRNDAEVAIGSSFVGEISNTFGSHEGQSKLRIYLNNITDQNGNQLVSYGSKNDNDALHGELVFTSVNDDETIYSVPVTLDNISYFDVELPDVEGTFDLALRMFTDSELIEPDEPIDESLQGILLSPDELTLFCKASYQLKASSIPENVELDDLIWTSSNEEVATVDQNGVIQTSDLTRGTTTITVSTADGLYTATCELTVKFSFFQWLRWFFTFGFIRELFGSSLGPVIGLS